MERRTEQTEERFTHTKGVSESAIAVVASLKETLADEYMLMLKTQNCHWNVEGPLFHSLHKTFEHQYEEMFEHIDEIAEVIRAMNSPAPGSFAEYQEITNVEELRGKISATEMIDLLSQDHDTMANLIKDRRKKADEAEEVNAVVLYEDLIQFHEKASWMIRSHRERN